MRKQRFALVPMTFEEIERVTGVELPPKAQHHRAWWSNNPSNNVMTKVWLDAGYQTEQVDMVARKLVFRRVQTPSRPEPEGPGKPDQNGPRKRHPLFGILKELTQIVPGTDLTEPADPNWGEDR